MVGKYFYSELSYLILQVFSFTRHGRRTYAIQPVSHDAANQTRTAKATLVAA